MNMEQYVGRTVILSLLSEYFYFAIKFTYTLFCYAILYWSSIWCAQEIEFRALQIQLKQELSKRVSLATSPFTIK